MFLRYGVWQTEFFIILDNLHFYLPKNSKIQNFEKMKKSPGDVIILHKCTKNDDHMLYCSWYMVHDGRNYFSFWATFCLFTAPNHPKTQNFKKWKKYLEILSLYTCVPEIMTRWWLDHQMMYGSWHMVYEIWCATDRQIGRWKKWPQRWVLPPKNNF